MSSSQPSSSQPSRAVLFDLDGVLAATETLKAAAHASTIAALGGDVPAVFYGRLMGASHAVVRGAFIAEARIDCDPGEYSRLYQARYLRLLETDLEALPGVEELLARLQADGFGLAVITSSQPWMVDRVFAQLGLARWIGLTITADDVEHHKPAPDAYLLARRRLGVDATRAVVIEDSEVGVQAGLAAGLQVIAVRHSFNATHRFAGAAREIRSLSDTGAVIRLVQELTESSQQGLSRTIQPRAIPPNRMPES